MGRKVTPTPAPSTIRCRLHRRRKALMSDFQQLIYTKAAVNHLDALSDAIEALKERSEDE